LLVSLFEKAYGLDIHKDDAAIGLEDIAPHQSSRKLSV